MNTKTILITLLVVFGLTALMIWGGSNQVVAVRNSLSATSSLIASETLYDFGTISMSNGLVDHMFTITNPTGKDVEVKTISTSCMCTRAYIESANGQKGPFGMPGHGNFSPPVNEIIRAGESRTVKVVYDPNVHGPAGVGQIDRFVYITDVSGGVLQLEIKAVVTP